MSYQVISCRDCGSPRIVEAKRKTSQCPRCGKSLDLDRVLVHAETDAIEEARDAVGQINARRADGELLREPEPKTVEPADRIDQALQQARDATGQAMRVKLAAQGLSETFETFDEARWVQALERLDIQEGRAREHLDRLVQMSMLAQPRPGSYTWVG